MRNHIVHALLLAAVCSAHPSAFGQERGWDDIIECKLRLENEWHSRRGMQQEKSHLELLLTDQATGVTNPLREVPALPLNAWSEIDVVLERGKIYTLDVARLAGPEVAKYKVWFKPRNIKREMDYQFIVNDSEWAMSPRANRRESWIDYKQNTSISLRVVDTQLKADVFKISPYDLRLFHAASDAAYTSLRGQTVGSRAIGFVGSAKDSERFVEYPNSYFVNGFLPISGVGCYGVEYEVDTVFVDEGIGYRAVLLRSSSGAPWILAFAGSDSVTDVVIDGLQLIPRVTTAQYKRALSDAKKALKMCKAQGGIFSSGSSRLIVTGHSLGGGLACYCSCMLGIRGIGFNPAPLRGALYSVRSKGVDQANRYFTNVAAESDFVSHRSPGLLIGEYYVVDSSGEGELSQHKLGLMDVGKFKNYENSSRRPYN